MTRKRGSVAEAAALTVLFLVCPVFCNAADWGSLPAPTSKRIVLHGVAVDPASGALRKESIPVLDEAATVLGQTSAAVVVAGSESTTLPRKIQIPPQECPQEIVRSYFMTHGVPHNRVTEVAWLSPDPADSVTNQCRVGFLAD